MPLFVIIFFWGGSLFVLFYCCSKKFFSIVFNFQSAWELISIIRLEITQNHRLDHLITINIRFLLNWDRRSINLLLILLNIFLVFNSMWIIFHWSSNLLPFDSKLVFLKKYNRNYQKFVNQKSPERFKSFSEKSNFNLTKMLKHSQ